MLKTYNQFTIGENRSLLDQGGFYSFTNVDVHGDLGVAQNQLALESESTTPNESFISEILSNGDAILCSTTSGKIWKKTAAGVFSLVHTNTNGACKGVKLWLGYLYYSTTSKLGKIAEANASSEASWASQNDSWASYTIGGAYKPMTIVGSGLYIGDGYYVAVVDSTHTFIADALDIPSMFTITVLADRRKNLFIGTIIGNNVPWCQTYTWNRISPSWNDEAKVREIGINTYIEGDNIDILSVGKTGQLMYVASDSSLLKLKKIKGVTTGVNPYNSTVFKGRPLFAVETKIYSIHREDGDFPYACTAEFSAPGTITSINATADNLIVSYGAGAAKIGSTYATAVLETPQAEGIYKNVEVTYRSMAEGATVGISTSVDGAAYVAQTPVVDTVNRKVSFNGGLPFSTACQAKITLTGLVKIKKIELL